MGRPQGRPFFYIQAGLIKKGLKKAGTVCHSVKKLKRGEFNAQKNGIDDLERTCRSS